MARILVIDDEAPIRALLTSVLESAGHDVTEAATGREGLAVYRQRPADLVIVDLLMPELSGLETILELTREFLNVKVITISGMADDQSLLKARLLGARQSFHKPFEFDKLLCAIRYELVH